MIDYLLTVPRKLGERPDRPRRTVRVFMRVDNPDIDGQIEFVGDSQDVAALRDELFLSARGYRGAQLDEEPTARNLAVAMGELALQPYEPALLTGDELFQPADAAVAARLVRLGRDIAAVIAGILPRLPSYEMRARGELIERLRLIVARGRSLADSAELPVDAMAIVVAATQSELATAGFDFAQLNTAMRENYDQLELTEFLSPQSSDQIIAVLRTLVAALQAPMATDFRSLVGALEVSWAASEAS